MSEKEFQRIVERALKQRGYIVWHVVDSRLMAAGLPDIIAVSPQRPDRRVLFYELKSERGRVRPMQRVVMTALDGIDGIDARIVRPSQWSDVLLDLDRRRADAREALAPAATRDELGGGE